MKEILLMNMSETCCERSRQDQGEGHMQKMSNAKTKYFICFVNQLCLPAEGFHSNVSVQKPSVIVSA